MFTAQDSACSVGIGRTPSTSRIVCFGESVIFWVTVPIAEAEDSWC